MRILVTNDDGIASEGLHAIAAALVAEGHDVVVAAPSSDLSGSGSSLGTLEDGARIGCRPVELTALPGVPCWSLDAPPAFTVLAASAGLFGDRPELVVSGINPGPNTGRMILGSSTVGAVLTANAVRVRGVALSCGFPPDHRFDTAARVGVAVVAWVADHPVYDLLNVNVPDCDLADIRGVRMAPLAHRGLMGLRFDHEPEAIVLSRYAQSKRLGEDTDSDLLSRGFVAVSALRNLGTIGEDDDAGLAAALEAELGAALTSATAAR